jgi:hypothetical protein
MDCRSTYGESIHPLTKRRGNCCWRRRAIGRSSCTPGRWWSTPRNAPEITLSASPSCTKPSVKVKLTKPGWPVSNRRTTSSLTSITGCTRRKGECRKISEPPVPQNIQKTVQRVFIASPINDDLI